MRISDEEMDRVIAETMSSLPPEIAAAMENIELVVEDSPGPEVSDELAPALLGLYHGIPLTERTNASYYGVLPDRISLYKKNLEGAARNVEDLKQLIRDTVIHEIAHHFGIDDDRLHELGWA